MIEYNVFVDRRRKSPKMGDNSLHLPFAKEGRLWRDIIRFTRYAPSRVLDERIWDIIDVATAIFHADKLCPRGRCEQWTRKFVFHAELRDPEAFEEIREELILALSLLGADNFQFNISQLENWNAPRVKITRRNGWSEITDIALLSGGQDSVTGALGLLNERKKPLLIRVNTNDKANLTATVNLLQKKAGRTLPFYSQTVTALKNAGRNQNLGTEPSQRLRSFYFLAIGSVFARIYGISTLHIHENGIMAIHLPFDPARASSFSTRTAFPLYIQTFEKLISKWLDYSIAVRNRFVLNTKAEVIDSCSDELDKKLISETVSCAHSATVQRTIKTFESKPYLLENKTTLHCGYCFPCILRRISMWSAGLADVDVKYAFNPFKLFMDGSADNYDLVYEATSAVLGLFRLVNKFERNELVELLSEYPQIIEATYAFQDATIDDVVELHRRFAKEVISYVEKEVPYLAYFFDQQASLSLEQRVKVLASEQFINKILDKYNASASDAFYKQIKSSYATLRLRIQVALYNDQMSESKMEKRLAEAVGSVVGNRPKPVTLKQSDGKEIRESLWKRIRSEPCPPFWN